MQFWKPAAVLNWGDIYNRRMGSTYWNLGPKRAAESMDMNHTLNPNS